MLRIIKSKDLVEDAIRELDYYQKGIYSPIHTGIEHLDYNLMGGLFPKEVIVLPGLSGSGKTYLLQRIEENMFKKDINPNADDLRLVRCNWEMSVDALLMRRLAKETSLDIDEIRSRPFEGQAKEIASAIREKESNERIFYMPDVAMAKEFEESIEAFLNEQPTNVHTVVSIDHIGLVKSGLSKKMSIDDLVATCNKLKKRYRVTFLIVSQLNRDIESRIENRKSHYPKSSDLYESSNMFQLSDYTVVVHRPELIHIQNEYMKFNASAYGWLDKYKTEDGTGFKTEGLIFYHYIKMRNIRNREFPKKTFIEVLPGYEQQYSRVRQVNKQEFRTPYKD